MRKFAAKTTYLDLPRKFRDQDRFRPHTANGSRPLPQQHRPRQDRSPALLRPDRIPLPPVAAGERAQTDLPVRGQFPAQPLPRPHTHAPAPAGGRQLHLPQRTCGAPAFAAEHLRDSIVLPQPRRPDAVSRAHPLVRAGGDQPRYTPRHRPLAGQQRRHARHRITCAHGHPQRHPQQAFVADAHHAEPAQSRHQGRPCGGRHLAGRARRACRHSGQKLDETQDRRLCARRIGYGQDRLHRACRVV